MTYEEISLVATSTETAFDNHDVNRDTCVVGYPETEAIERQNNYPLVWKIKLANTASGVVYRESPLETYGYMYDSSAKGAQLRNVII